MSVWGTPGRGFIGAVVNAYANAGVTGTPTGGGSGAPVWGAGIGPRGVPAGLAPIAGGFGFDFYRSSRASALPVDFVRGSLRAELLAKRSGVFVGRRMLRRRRVREL